VFVLLHPSAPRRKTSTCLTLALADLAKQGSAFVEMVWLKQEKNVTLILKQMEMQQTSAVKSANFLTKFLVLTTSADNAPGQAIKQSVLMPPKISARTTNASQAPVFLTKMLGSTGVKLSTSKTPLVEMATSVSEDVWKGSVLNMNQRWFAQDARRIKTFLKNVVNAAATLASPLQANVT